MTTAKTTLLRLLAALLLACAVALPLARPAHAATAVTSYVAQGVIAADGTLTVKATITPEGAAGDLVQRFATTMLTTDDREYRFAVTDIAVTVAGRDAGAKVTTEPGYVVVTIPSPGTEPLTLAYTVGGAAFDTDGTTTVAWRLLQGLNVPVRSFEATLDTPGAFTMIDCAAGPPANPGACGWYSGGTHDQPEPAFNDGPRGAGEVVQVTVRFPAATVASNSQLVDRWSLDRAFSAAPLPLGLALGVGAIGLAALWGAHRRFGRDAVDAAQPVVVASFRPVGDGRSEFQVVDDVRPGHVGTLLDERVDPVDVTATILDLAVRGALSIRELPRASEFARTDWQLVRADAATELRPYEATLLDAVAPAAGPRRVSELAVHVGAALSAVQSQLYDEVVQRGWYARRPDATRGAWTTVGRLGVAAALVAAALLVAFTSFGLLGLVLIALAFGVGFVGQAMPSRTAAGASVLAGLGVLRGQLLTQPTGEMPPGREHRELSEVLPFAVVLGGTERWLDALVATDTDDTPDESELGWFHGPEGWHLRDLPDSLRNLVTTLEGVLVER